MDALRSLEALPRELRQERMLRVVRRTVEAWCGMPADLSVPAPYPWSEDIAAAVLGADDDEPRSER